MESSRGIPSRCHWLWFPYHSDWWNMLKLTPKNTRMTGQTWFSFVMTLGRDDEMSQVLTTATLDLAILKRNKRPAGKLIAISQACHPSRLHFGHRTSLTLGFGWFSIAWGFLEIGVGKIGEAFQGWMMSNRDQVKFSHVTCCTHLLRLIFHYDVSWAKATHKTFWPMNPNGCIHECVPDILRCSFAIVYHVVRIS